LSKPNTLHIVRGLPGSGKTTLAARLTKDSYCADDYFTAPDDTYHFNASKLPEAHAQCQACVKAAMLRKLPIIAVHNTFTQAWEIAPYLELARENDYSVVFHSLFDGGLSDAELAQRNVHGVPAEAIARMRARWENIYRNLNLVVVMDSGLISESWAFANLPDAWAKFDAVSRQLVHTHADKYFDETDPIELEEAVRKLPIGDVYDIVRNITDNTGVDIILTTTDN